MDLLIQNLSQPTTELTKMRIEEDIFIKNVVQLFRVLWEMSEAGYSPGPEAGGKPPHCLGALTQLYSSANPPPRKPIGLLTSRAASVQVPSLCQNLSIDKFKMV